MDIELALIAERLQLRLPYLRGEKNDRRLAHDFLERLVSDGKKSLRKKRADNDNAEYTDAVNALDLADRLLLSWANRASHTFNLVRPEAEKLIDACEKSIECLRCSSCGKNVWFADASDWTQCQCGSLRWRH
jgi:hypothetical protein